MAVGHVGLNVPDLDTARAYYDQLMPALGYEPFVVDDDQFAYLPADNRRGAFVFFYPSAEPDEDSRHTTGLQHLAFMVDTRPQVDAVHALVADLGSEVVHAPREWPEYLPAGSRLPQGRLSFSRLRARRPRSRCRWGRR
jgi:catechol 2,3-dioxygenase-like lactoylglutathione lyase family enzyme